MLYVYFLNHNFLYYKYKIFDYVYQIINENNEFKIFI